nr:ribonuclease H-like domain-containing protein [Tanacetum cinerariifolium]
MTIIGTSLVAQGYNQQEGIDYDESYASVAKLESIKILLAYAYALDFKLFQMDIRSAFLNGFINEEVYVAQPPGFIDFERLNHVYKLKIASYGPKQAPKTQGLVRGLSKIKFEKDHLCSACAMGKSTKKSHKPKSEDTNQEKPYLLHMDLCGPMRVESVNEKKYILIIVDDYSRFTWVKFLRSKDEAPDFIIKFLKMIQVRLKVPVRHIRTDNETEFINQTLREYYEEVGISHETSVALSLQQNGVVERCNRTLIEAARTIPVSTRLQLYEQALFCYYDAFLTSVEPKTYKETLTQSCWIEVMQEEFNEFERLEVWELIPRPDKVMVITLKLFKHVVSIFLELAIDKYLLFYHVMRPLAPHYERKTQSDHGKKRTRKPNASSSSATQYHPFLSLPPDAMIDENNDESSHPNSSSPSQQVSSSSIVISRVCQNTSHESHILDTFLSETINLQTQQ